MNTLDYALHMLERMAEVFDAHSDESYSGSEIARCIRGCAVAVAKDNDLAREDS